MRTRNIFILLSMAAILGCGQKPDSGAAVKLYTDIHGFVFHSSSKPPRLLLGVGDSGEKLLQQNPFLKGVLWLPKAEEKQVMDEMRLSLQATTDVHYSDGDLRLQVCAHSVSADGNSAFKLGVAFVGIKLCEAPVNDYKRALQLAKEVVTQLQQENPRIHNLNDFYRKATQAQLLAMGGHSWADAATKYFCNLPARRDNPDSGEYLYGFEEADVYFSNTLTNPRFKDDVNGQPRLQGGDALLGVYAGKYAIFEIGVTATQNWGGTNLTPAQLDEQRYDISMHFRLRNDVDPRGIGRD
ncbi:MAG: hypothetical protein HY080_07805 [Gammaproteobacteria bacterium]|nr:hypothetical protein [Gammaproteobacteria bacterium]